MSWLIKLISSLFGVFLTELITDYKKPHEAEVLGGDEEIEKDIDDFITNQIIEDDKENGMRKNYDHG